MSCFVEQLQQLILHNKLQGIFMHLCGSIYNIQCSRHTIYSSELMYIIKIAWRP